MRLFLDTNVLVDHALIRKTGQPFEANLEVLNISTIDTQTFTNGLQSDFTDIEDSFQYFSALKSNCDFLLTTNLTDYRCVDNGNITVTSPLNFLITVLKKQKGIDF